MTCVCRAWSCSRQLARLVVEVIPFLFQISAAWLLKMLKKKILPEVFMKNAEKENSSLSLQKEMLKKKFLLNVNGNDYPTLSSSISKNNCKNWMICGTLLHASAKMHKILLENAVKPINVKTSTVSRPLQSTCPLPLVRRSHMTPTYHCFLLLRNVWMVLPLVPMPAMLPHAWAVSWPTGTARWATFRQWRGFL